MCFGIKMICALHNHPIVFRHSSPSAMAQTKQYAQISTGAKGSPAKWAGSLFKSNASFVTVTSECTALLGRRSGSGGYRTVASAHALRQPTSCGSEYFYNQCPRVPNLIGIEHSLNRGEHRV